MGAVPADGVSAAISGEADLVSRLAGLAGGERASRLAAIVESCDDAIIGKTLDGTITSWNHGASVIYGYTAEEMIGQNVSELFPADKADELAPILDRLRRGLRIDHYVTRRVCKDGTVIDVSISVSPILDENGTIVGAANVARDISAHVRAEANRRVIETRQRQSELLATVRRLASGVAHDFSDAIGVILACVGLMSDQVPEGAELRADVQAIEGAAQRAARLTRQLLIFSQHDVVQPRELDLNQVISDLGEELAASLGGGIDLRFRWHADRPRVWADRGHIEQVLMSLAENARDAMPAGGTLTIGTDVTDLDQAYCARHPGTVPGHFVELSVRDTGTGMTAAVAAQIFEPFFTTKPFGRGTGLGLATVLNIVTRAAGTMSVDTQEGSGSAFRVFLRPIGLSQPREAAAAPVGGERVLVVDDDPELLSIVSRLLARAGYEVTPARTGEEAMAQASLTDPGVDLLLIDTLWPELASRLTQRRPGLPVLYMSSDSGQMLGTEPAWYGSVKVIKKPFTTAALLEKVRAVLAGP